METNIIKILDSEDFKNSYKKTRIDSCKYLKLKSPIATQFELTGECNQKCIFCYNVWKEGCSNNTKKLSKKEQFEVIDKLIENEVFDIIFSGGEPLLIPWLDELIKKCSDANMYTTIITNGVLMTKERGIKLKNAGLKDLQISLHHFKPEANDRLTNVQGSFDKSIRGIKNSLDIFGVKNININMVALPKTYKEIYNFIKFLKNLGVGSFSVGTPSFTGDMKKDKSLIISKKMFLNIYHQLKKAKEDFEVHVGFSGGFPLCLLPKMDKDSIEMIGNLCDAGLNQIIIGPNGDLRPCVCLNNTLGNILKDDFKEIWKNHPILLKLRKMEFVPRECNGCEYISICRGGCRASANGYFGRMDAIDPLMKNE